MRYQRSVVIDNEIDACARYNAQIDAVGHLTHAATIVEASGHKYDNEEILGLGDRIDTEFESVLEIWASANAYCGTMLNDEHLRLPNRFFSLMREFCRVSFKDGMHIMVILHCVDAMMKPGEEADSEFEDAMNDIIQNADDPQLSKAWERFLETYNYDLWPMVYDATLVVLHTLCKVTDSYRVYVHSFRRN